MTDPRNDLDASLINHYRAHSLDEDQLEHILESGNASAEVAAAIPRGISGKPWTLRAMQWGFAASLLMGVAWLVHSVGTIGERTDVALREAAMNHTRRLNVEFTAQEVAHLEQEMTQLPFSIALPSRLSDDYTLLGARYCTMSGKLAVHVKLRHETDGRPVSLFMTDMADELQHVRAKDKSINGVEVDLWHEGGLFYAMAEVAS